MTALKVRKKHKTNMDTQNDGLEMVGKGNSL